MVNICTEHYKALLSYKIQKLTKTSTCIVTIGFASWHWEMCEKVCYCKSLILDAANQMNPMSNRTFKSKPKANDLPKDSGRIRKSGKWIQYRKYFGYSFGTKKHTVLAPKRREGSMWPRPQQFVKKV